MSFSEHEKEIEKFQHGHGHEHGNTWNMEIVENMGRFSRLKRGGSVKFKIFMR